MAVFKIFPSKDATIYSFYPYMNTGIDEIIEVFNINLNVNPVPQVARTLIGFDQVEIDNIIDNNVGTSSFSSQLKCYIADANGIDTDTYVEIFPISGSWNNGTGTYLDLPLQVNGVSWRARTFSGSNEWVTSSFSTYVTASYSGNDYGGGNWFTGSNDPNNSQIGTSSSFSLKSKKDLSLDVSDIVNVWYSSSKSIGAFTDIPNQGLILKWEDAVEFSSNNGVQPILKYFSSDTHTIYPPTLEIKWDDQSFVTGSLTEITSSDFFAAIDNNPGIFYSESVNRFRLNVREKYPRRTFQTSSVYVDTGYLNSGSTYAVKDLDTNEYVIDFDTNYTKLSCDEKGNYFDIYMGGLQPERYYELLIKTIISGSTIVHKDNYYFKVVNG